MALLDERNKIIYWDEVNLGWLPFVGKTQSNIYILQQRQKLTLNLESGVIKSISHYIGLVDQLGYNLRPYPKGLVEISKGIFMYNSTLLNNKPLTRVGGLLPILRYPKGARFITLNNDLFNNSPLLCSYKTSVSPIIDQLATEGLINDTPNSKHIKTVSFMKDAHYSTPDIIDFYRQHGREIDNKGGSIKPVKYDNIWFLSKSSFCKHIGINTKTFDTFINKNNGDVKKAAIFAAKYARSPHRKKPSITPNQRIFKFIDREISLSEIAKLANIDNPTASYVIKRIQKQVDRNVPSTVVIEWLSNSVSSTNPVMDPYTNKWYPDKITLHNDYPGSDRTTIDQRLTEFHKRNVPQNVAREFIASRVAIGNICKDHKENWYPSTSKMCEAYSVHHVTFKNRLSKGWTLEKALTHKTDHADTMRRRNATVIDFIDKSILLSNIIKACRSEKVCRNSAHICKRAQQLAEYGIPSKDVIEWLSSDIIIRQPIQDPYTCEWYPTLNHLRQSYSAHHRYDIHNKLIDFHNRNIPHNIAKKFLASKIPRESMCQDHNGNWYLSQKEMCHAYNLSPSTLRRRLSLGLSLEDALIVTNK